MAVGLVIADWNGTLFADLNEGKTWEYVAWSGIPRHPSLLLAAPKLYKLKDAYKRGEIDYDHIYDEFNRSVLSRMPVSEVQMRIAKYAKRPETQAKIDERLWRPLEQARREDGMHSIILSTGCHEGISKILDGRWPDASNLPWFYPFDAVYANHVVPDGSGSMFDYKQIYRGGDKHALLLLDEGSHIDLAGGPSRVLYTGDSQTDEACMAWVKENGGMVAAPFFADDDFKQHLARTYGAFVPESEHDFRRILKTAM